MIDRNTPYCQTLYRTDVRGEVFDFVNNPVHRAIRNVRREHRPGVRWHSARPRWLGNGRLGAVLRVDKDEERLTAIRGIRRVLDVRNTDRRTGRAWHSQGKTHDPPCFVKIGNRPDRHTFALRHTPVFRSDTGTNRDQRQLKQRERGESRTAQCPPELTALLHAHIAEFGIGSDGRVFTGERNHAELPKLTIVRAWKRAPEEVFTAEVTATPLARRPYDLRHAAVSTWLNGGVPPTQVAEWAGQSVEVLLRIYAKCLDGGQEVLRQRVQAALGH